METTFFLHEPLWLWIAHGTDPVSNLPYAIMYSQGGSVQQHSNYSSLTRCEVKIIQLRRGDKTTQGLEIFHVVSSQSDGAKRNSCAYIVG